MTVEYFSMPASDRRESKPLGLSQRGAWTSIQWLQPRKSPTSVEHQHGQSPPLQGIYPPLLQD
jgi:hypothetical protein